MCTCALAQPTQIGVAVRMYTHRKIDVAVSILSREREREREREKEREYIYVHLYGKIIYTSRERNGEGRRQVGRVGGREKE